MVRYIFCVVIVVALASSALADLHVEWAYTGEDPDGFYFYRSYSSLTCEEEYNISSPTARSYDFPFAGSNFAFYVMTAYTGTEETPYSNEVILKECGGEQLCQADFTASADATGAFLQWEAIDSVVNYQIRYKLLSAHSYTVIDNVTDNFLSIDLPTGDYIFSLYAKDALGRTVETNNVYTDLAVNISNAPPPNPPSYKVEAFGADGVAGWNQTLMMAFDSDDTFVDYYHVDVFSSSALALSGKPGDIMDNVVVAKGSNFCQTIDASGYPILFFSVSSVDYDGQEGDGIVGYKLIGNVSKTDNDGTPFSSAAVDYGDKVVLKTYYYKAFKHRSADYCAETNLYDILPFSSQERMDYNQDGIVNFSEYSFFRTVYGHSGAGY